MQIVIDRIKYPTIEDLLDDYVFIQKPQSEKIVFLDLIESGHYYPYSSTKDWKFNSLYHIYKNLHIDNYEKTYFYNNDIHLDYNHKQIVKLLGLKKQINVKSFPWYSLFNGFNKGNFKKQEIKYEPRYNVIFMCGEQRLNRLMILNELHEYDKFIYSNRNPQIENPIAIKSLKYLKDDNLQVNGIITNSDVIAPNWVFQKKSWCSSIKKELTDKNDINILGDVPIEYHQSAIELVGESYTDKGCCLSEKLLKPFLYKKPFICMASRGYHTFLENQGFYLYNELFDYSFDNSTFENRFKSLMFQFKNILETPTEELKQKIYEIKYKFDYNFQLIRTILNDKNRYNYYDT